MDGASISGRGGEALFHGGGGLRETPGSTLYALECLLGSAKPAPRILGPMFFGVSVCFGSRRPGFYLELEGGVYPLSVRVPRVQVVGGRDQYTDGLVGLDRRW
jgi:hypothetical protein